MKLKYLLLALAFTIGCKSGSHEKTLKNGNKIVIEGSIEKGIQRTFSPSGTLLEELPLLNGKPNGLMREFFSNGKVKEATPIVNGFKHGIKKTYNIIGRIEQEVPYINGLEEGMVKLYYPNGKVKGQVTYSKGNPLEDLIDYDAEGKILPQPKIVIQVKNTIALDNKLTFILSLKPKVKNFNLYAVFPAEKEIAAYDKVKVKDGMGRYELYKYNGTSLFGELEVYAVYKSNSGLKGKVKTRIRVAE